jgi:hypothetical protein
MRRFLVSSFLADVTQQIHSFRASGVISAQRLFAAPSDSMALRKSDGSLWIAPPAIDPVVMRRPSCFVSPNIGVHQRRRMIAPADVGCNAWFGRCPCDISPSQRPRRCSRPSRSQALSNPQHRAARIVGQARPLVFRRGSGRPLADARFEQAEQHGPRRHGPAGTDAASDIAEHEHGRPPQVEISEGKEEAMEGRMLHEQLKLVEATANLLLAWNKPWRLAVPSGICEGVSMPPQRHRLIARNCGLGKKPSDEPASLVLDGLDPLKVHAMKRLICVHVVQLHLAFVGRTCALTRRRISPQRRQSGAARG